MNRAILWDTAMADAIGGRSEQQYRVAVFRDGGSGAVLAVVADGLGGHVGGAAAAQAVIDAAGEFWAQSPKPAAEPEQLLADICLAAHRRIVAMSTETGRDGHSTCALLYGDTKVTAWLHVGDSRVYHFRGATIVGHTRDHSLIQLMVERGDIQEAEMADHPDQNRLLQALGGDREPRPDSGQAQAGEGDAYLLCSDGLWEAITPDEMARALVGRPLATVARELTEVAATRRGPSSDNIAVALVRSTPHRPPPGRRRTRRAVMALLAAAVLTLLAAFSLRPGWPAWLAQRVVAGPAGNPVPPPLSPPEPSVPR